MRKIHVQMNEELTRRAIFEQAKRAAYSYMDTVRSRAVYPEPEAIGNLAKFDEPFPAMPSSGEAILDALDRYGSPATVAQTGGRYFGFVNGGCVPAALAARWLSDAWDQNAALYVISPIAAKLEQICEQWLTEIFGLPQGTAAGLVGGTSQASFCGFAAARHALLGRLGWDVNVKGLAAAPPLRIIVSEQAHSSVIKALALLGYGREQIEVAPSDPSGAIDP
ncbi:MAG TPA: pyridoxal-dependent decarboxylase, partial [Spirochaetia bacterium]|nr:pyridoxal-dependent decarboxylase [Spirochaetia bacterium]